MNFEEYAGKPLLRAAGIATPPGRLATTPDEAAEICGDIGPAVVKAQVPTGKRGKSGGIAVVAGPAEAREAAERILGMRIGEETVARVLVEEQVAIAREFYAAVLNDPTSKSPLVLFSPDGGMDIEEIAASRPDRLMRLAVDIRKGFDREAARAALPPLEGTEPDAFLDFLSRLYDAYAANDAELMEVNPLALTDGGDLVALDCKFTLDNSAIKRQTALSENGTPDHLTPLEARARDAGIIYIELDGDVGIIANGAGLTMTTMDAVSHFGGRPANFLEIGGEAYTLGRQALEICLANPNVKALLINFCGAFARTDVMTEGILSAWEGVAPQVPVSFAISGTGDREAIGMVRNKLGIEPHGTMDEAVRAAVEAAKGETAR